MKTRDPPWLCSHIISWAIQAVRHAPLRLLDGLGPYFFAGILIVARNIDTGVKERKIDRTKPLNEMLLKILYLLRVSNVTWFDDDLRPK